MRVRVLAMLLAAVLAGAAVGATLGRRHEAPRARPAPHVQRSGPFTARALPARVDGSEVTAAALGARGDVALGTASGTVVLYPPGARGWAGGRSFDVGGTVLELAVSADGGTVVAVARGAGILQQLVARGPYGRRLLFESPAALPFGALAVSPDGAQVAAQVTDAIVPFDAVAGRQLPAFRWRTLYGFRPPTVALGIDRADGTLIELGAGSNGWSLTTRRRVWSLPFTRSGEGSVVAVAPGAGTAAFGGADGRVTVRDLARGGALGMLDDRGRLHQSIRAVAIADDGEVAAVDGRTLSVWRSPDQRSAPERLRLPGPPADLLQTTARGDLVLAGTPPHAWLVAVRASGSSQG